MQGGILDANDDLGAGPKALILDPDRQRQPHAHEPLRHQPRQPDDDRRLDVRGAVH